MIKPSKIRRWLSGSWHALRGRGKILFYASSWMDEIWVRTTALACSRRGLSVALLVDGDPAGFDPEVLAVYRAASIPVLNGGTPKTPLVVSASTGASIGRFKARKVHMPHSLVSMHMIYEPAAFDHFDDILAAGPHHIEEAHALTRQRNLPERRVHAAGYGKLDLLMSDHTARRDAVRKDEVLIAPSWGPSNMLSSVSPDWIGRLLEDGCRVVLRPHPLFFTVHAEIIDVVRERFGAHPNFVLESPSVAGVAIHSAAVLVTDYSGIALEYAAVRLRPVVFVDVAPKVFNPTYIDLPMVPIEIRLRDRLGLLAASEPDAIYTQIRAALDAPDAEWPERIRKVLPEFIYNPGKCADAATAILFHMARS